MHSRWSDICYKTCQHWPEKKRINPVNIILSPNCQVLKSHSKCMKLRSSSKSTIFHAQTCQKWQTQCWEGVKTDIFVSWRGTIVPPTFVTFLWTHTPLQTLQWTLHWVNHTNNAYRETFPLVRLEKFSCNFKMSQITNTYCEKTTQMVKGNCNRKTFSDTLPLLIWWPLAVAQGLQPDLEPLWLLLSVTARMKQWAENYPRQELQSSYESSTGYEFFACFSMRMCIDNDF